MKKKTQIFRGLLKLFTNVKRWDFKTLIMVHKILNETKKMRK